MRDETVLYDASTNKFCLLNQTSAFLWGQLTEPRTQKELADLIQESFSEVDQETAERDVADTVREFSELSLVSVA